MTNVVWNSIIAGASSMLNTCSIRRLPNSRPVPPYPRRSDLLVSASVAPNSLGVSNTPNVIVNSEKISPTRDCGQSGNSVSDPGWKYWCPLIASRHTTMELSTSTASHIGEVM